MLKSGKNSILGKLLTDSFFYGIANYLGVVVSLFLFPVYTRIFTKAEYGVLDIFNVWNGFFLIVIPLGLYSAILRFYPDVKTHSRILKYFYGTTFWAFVFISVIFLVFMLVFKSFIYSKAMLLPEEYAFVYYLSVLIVINTLFLEYFKTFFRIRFERNKFMIVSLINFGFLAFLGFALVVLWGFRIEGFFIASIVGLIISNLLAFLFFVKQLSFRFSFKLLKKLLNYSVHFISVSLLFKATELIDRFLLNNYFGLSSVGEYSIGVKIAWFYNIIVSAITFAWMPYILSFKDSGRQKELIKHFASLFIAFSIIFLGVLIIFRSVLIQVLAPGYVLAVKLIPIVVSYLFVNGFVYFFTLGIQIRKITKYFTLSGVVAVLINIVSSYLLLFVFHEVGIAIGSLLASFVWVGILFYFSQKAFYVRYDKNIIPALISYFLFVFVSLFELEWVSYVLFIICVYFSYLLIKNNLNYVIKKV